MAVLHPHYITAGRYTSKIDRKLLAGIFETDSTGKILTGVLPPEDHFFATGDGLTVSVSPGFAVIADSASQSSVSPGAYFCTIDADSETVTLTSDPGLYQIYAEVKEDQVDVTYKSSTGGIATLTTATNHGFKVGQTVLISGVDSTFDGSYVLTSGTDGTTIKYEKSGTVSNTAVSPVGKASVPFAIKATSAGDSIPSGNTIEIAAAKVSGGVITSVIDKRTYVTARGAVQLYRSLAVNASGTTAGPGSTATTPSIGSGRMSYDLSSGNISYYDAISATSVPIVIHSTGHHDDEGTDSSATAVHHSLGTGPYQAAAGNHTHAKSPTNINSPSVVSDTSTSVTVSSSDSASPTTITGAAITYNYASGFTGNLVGLITGTVTVEWTSNATYFVDDTIVYIGVSTSGANTSDDVAFSGLSSASNVVGKGTTATTGVLSTNRLTIPFTRVVDFNQTGAHTITLKAYRNNTDNVVKVVQYNMAFVPIRAY